MVMFWRGIPDSEMVDASDGLERVGMLPAESYRRWRKGESTPLSEPWHGLVVESMPVEGREPDGEDPLDLKGSSPRKNGPDFKFCEVSDGLIAGWVVDGGQTGPLQFK